MNTRIVIILRENSADANSVASQIAGAIKCSVFTGRGIRAGLSLIASEKPEIALIDEGIAALEQPSISDLIASISPETRVVIVQNDSGSKMHDAAAAE